MSFNIALSGINAINKQLTITSHNIANGATIGFKASRANFATMMAGDQGNGTSVASVTQSIGGGSAGVFSTGVKLDAAIQGNGFFVTRNAEGNTLFTRAGIFHRSQDGYIVDTFGHRVQGYAMGGAYGDLHTPADTDPAKASTRLSYAGNLSASAAAPQVDKFDKANANSYSKKITSTVYDSLGGQHQVEQYFVKLSNTPASSIPTKSAEVLNTYAVYYVVDDKPASNTPVLLKFDEHGALKDPSVFGTFSVSGPGFAKGDIKVDYTGTTQYASDTTTTTNQADGHQSGVPGEPMLDKRGNVVVQYSNGEKRTLGTLALATFANPDGLEAVGDTAWTASTASGNPLLGTPGAGGLGELVPGALELSNADVTNELVTMMAAQRNYQANSKVLSIENQMMQSLMQAL